MANPFPIDITKHNTSGRPATERAGGKPGSRTGSAAFQPVGCGHFAQSGADAYHFEWQVDAKKTVKKIGKQVSLIGNVNNPQVLFLGTSEQVYEQARYAIQARVNIVEPECAIPLATPIENLKAIVSAAREGY